MKSQAQGSYKKRVLLCGFHRILELRCYLIQSCIAIPAYNKTSGLMISTSNTYFDTGFVMPMYWP